MSDKQKKFQPTAGFMVSVLNNVIGIRAVAHELDIFPENLANALERAGYQIVPDPFDLSADSGKVIALQEQQKAQGLKVVKDESDSDTGADRETTV